MTTTEKIKEFHEAAKNMLDNETNSVSYARTQMIVADFLLNLINETDLWKDESPAEKDDFEAAMSNIFRFAGQILISTMMHRWLTTPDEAREALDQIADYVESFAIYQNEPKIN